MTTKNNNKITLNNLQKYKLYENKDFKKISFLKYITNYPIMEIRYKENLLIGCFLGNIITVFSPNTIYPWYISLDFKQSVLNFKYIKWIYSNFFLIVKEPPIIRDPNSKKTINSYKYLMPPIKKWQYGSNFTAIYDIRFNEKIIWFRTLGHIQFYIYYNLLFDKKGFLKVNYISSLLNEQILTFWYLSEINYKSYTIYFLNIKFLKIQCKNDFILRLSKCFGFKNLIFDNQFIYFKGINYYKFKKIIHKNSPIVMKWKI